jgi:hypothetical protein
MPREKRVTRAFLVGHSSRESETTGERFRHQQIFTARPVQCLGTHVISSTTTQPLARFGEVESDGLLPLIP